MVTSVQGAKSAIRYGCEAFGKALAQKTISQERLNELKSEGGIYKLIPPLFGTAGNVAATAFGVVGLFNLAKRVYQLFQGSEELSRWGMFKSWLSTALPFGLSLASCFGSKKGEKILIQEKYNLDIEDKQKKFSRNVLKHALGIINERLRANQESSSCGEVEVISNLHESLLRAITNKDTLTAHGLERCDYGGETYVQLVHINSDGSRNNLYTYRDADGEEKVVTVRLKVTNNGEVYKALASFKSLTIHFVTKDVDESNDLFENNIVFSLKDKTLHELHTEGWVDAKDVDYALLKEILGREDIQGMTTLDGTILGANILPMVQGKQEDTKRQLGRNVS